MRTSKIFTLLLALVCGAFAFAGPINVNTATPEQLAAELNGVGLSKARAIVAFREQHGPFGSIAELAQVRGIGVKLLERNRENILLRDPG
jgi:competence protein ComEA